MLRFVRFLSRHPLKVFLVYSFVVAIFIQAVALPLMFPSAHAGDGMLKVGDWISYNKWALESAEIIRTQGWAQHLQQRKDQNIEYSVLTILYHWIHPKPWVALPLLVLFHSLSALVIFRLLLSISRNRTSAFVATLPYFLFPTSLVWVSQVHKDGAVFLGFFLYLLGWVWLFEGDWSRFQSQQARRIVRSTVVILVGSLILWRCRGYFGYFIHYAIGTLGLVILTVVLHLRNTPFRYRVMLLGYGLLIVVGLSKWLPGSGLDFVKPLPLVVDGVKVTKVGQLRKIAKKKAAVRVAVAAPVAKTEEGPAEPVPARAPAPAPEAESAPKMAPAPAPVPVVAAPVVEPSSMEEIRLERPRVWLETEWLPEAWDRRFFAVSAVRWGYLLTKSKSNIDDHDLFYSALDVVLYIPRAIVVGFLAPFPSMWMGDATSDASSKMRYLAGLEMAFAYLMLPFLFAALFLYRRCPQFWFLFLSCLATLVLLSSAVPNVGTLHRFRFGFWTFFLGFSICAVIQVVPNIRTYFQNVGRFWRGQSKLEPQRT